MKILFPSNEHAGVWVRTTANTNSSLFKGWVMLCPCSACAERMKVPFPSGMFLSQKALVRSIMNRV